VQWDLSVTCASVQIVDFYTEATDEVPWIIPLQHGLLLMHEQIKDDVDFEQD